MSVKTPLKKYVMDESLSWEERYRKLDAHHLEETQWLIAELERSEAEARWFRGELEIAWLVATTPTEVEELKKLHALLREYNEGSYSQLGIEGEFAYWLDATASPSSWWPRLPEFIRKIIEAQVACRVDGIILMSNAGPETYANNRAMLERLAKELGLP